MPGRIGHFYIDDTCIGCGACEHACPGKVEAIDKVEGDFMGRFVISPEECIDCGFCIPVCPVNCIHDARKEGIDAERDGGWTRIRELQAWAAKAQGEPGSPLDGLAKFKRP
jgi:formate hydrogenlyase subunit 6/NADH:ubiquinone oxidoreductase subunit I